MHTPEKGSVLTGQADPWAVAHAVQSCRRSAEENASGALLVGSKALLEAARAILPLVGAILLQHPELIRPWNALYDAVQADTTGQAGQGDTTPASQNSHD